MNFSNDARYKRQAYIDGTIDEALKYEFFQFKYDGQWCKLVKEESETVRVISRTGKIKHEFCMVDFPRNTVFLAEYMFGTQWAQDVDRVGRFFLFDCLCFEGLELHDWPYRERYQRALWTHRGIHGKDQRFDIVHNYPIDDLPRFWSRISNDRSYEGIVARNWNQKYEDKIVRAKIDVTDDFMVIAVNEGLGRLAGSMGSVTVGQYTDPNDADSFVEVMTVGGGFSDELRKEIWMNRSNMFGRVIQVTGKQRFDSGALRHPNFDRFRLDKSGIECLLTEKTE